MCRWEIGPIISSFWRETCAQIFHTFCIILFSGISSSDSFSGSETLCSAENFTPSKWLTLGRADFEDPPHCPLVGEYSGILPDAEGLCARSYADCNNPEVMFYTVFNCGNASEVYEEREYRCFGQWSEPETGLVYTYTERRDIPGKECFVGVTMEDDDRHLVTEAGANCERGHQPRKYGMTLRRQSVCPSKASSGGGGLPVVTVTSVPPMNKVRVPITPSTPTTWRPISPRLSTVRSVTVVDGVEQLLEQIEEEEENNYYDKEFDQTFRPRHKHGHKHGYRHRGDSSGDQDIFTNEIPGSRTQSSAANGIYSSSLIASLVTLLLLHSQT
jgi:hypothetical protein